MTSFMLNHYVLRRDPHLLWNSCTSLMVHVVGSCLCVLNVHIITISKLEMCEGD